MKEREGRPGGHIGTKTECFDLIGIQVTGAQPSALPETSEGQLMDSSMRISAAEVLLWPRLRMVCRNARGVIFYDCPSDAIGYCELGGKFSGFTLTHCGLSPSGNYGFDVTSECKPMLIVHALPPGP